MPDDENVKRIANALQARARTPAQRASKLAKAYLDATEDRAVAVTTATELPPTAMKQAHISLLISLLPHFKDVPTRDELAALLRITKATARSLLTEILAASDTAAGYVLKSVFSRAVKGEQTGPGGTVKNGYEWSFATSSDLKLAQEQLEFHDVNFSTKSTTDGKYVLLIDPDFDPANVG